MITTKTTGTCDRCKNEVETDFYTLTINPEKIVINQYAGGYMSNFHLSGDSIRLTKSDAYHLCQDCLNKFKKFVNNV